MNNFDALCNSILEANVPNFVGGKRARIDQEKGEKYEELFPKIARQNNLKTDKATEHEETRLHFDYKVTDIQTGLPAWQDRIDNTKVDKNKTGFVEVKGAKENLGPYKLLEFIGSYGYKGWMYGKSNYIAFYNENTGGFDMVKTSSLLTEVENLGKFTMYGRDDSNDVEIFYTSNTSRMIPAKRESEDRRNAILIPHEEAVFYTRKPKLLDACLYVPTEIVMKHKKFELNPKA